MNTLHHVGYVVASIAAARENFSAVLGGAECSPISEDPIQRVRVAFLGAPGQPQIELIEPATPDSPVNKFLDGGGGLHHLCYETGDLEEELIRQRTLGGVVIRKPRPAAAFEGRRIAWVVTSEKLVLEFLERRKPAVDQG